MDSLLSTAPYPEKNWEIATGAILWTAMRRTRAIAADLARMDFPEAAILARTLIDMTVSCAYLLEREGLAREHLASRFMNFEPVQFGTLIDRWNRQRGEAIRLPSVSAKRRKAVGVFTDIEQKQSMGWSGKSQDQMVAAIKVRELRSRLRRLREDSGFLLSAFVHPTPMGVRAAQGWDEIVCADVESTVGICLMILCVTALPELGIDAEDLFAEGGRWRSAELRMDRIQYRPKRARMEDEESLPLLDLLRGRSSRQ